MDPDLQIYRKQPDNSASLRKKKLTATIGLALICLVVLIAILWFINYLSLRHFRVVSTNPLVTSVDTVTPFFNITYNKPLTENNLFVSSSPNIVKSYSVSNDTLYITLNEPMNPKTTYKITVKSIEDTSGDTLSNQTFSFEPKSVQAGNVPTNQKQKLLQQQENYAQSQSKQDPILSSLPYNTLDFSLSPIYVGTPPKLELQAQILIPPGADQSERTQYTAQYEQEVVQYIKSLGLNPSNYTIQYQIVNETLNGP